MESCSIFVILNIFIIQEISCIPSAFTHVLSEYPKSSTYFRISIGAIFVYCSFICRLPNNKTALRFRPSQGKEGLFDKRYQSIEKQIIEKVERR